MVTSESEREQALTPQSGRTIESEDNGHAAGRRSGTRQEHAPPPRTWTQTLSVAAAVVSLSIFGLVVCMAIVCIALTGLVPRPNRTRTVT